MLTNAKGLQTKLCMQTGNIMLRYYYPISAKNIGHYQAMAIRNVNIETFRNKAGRTVTFAVLNLYGPSVTVMDEYRRIQRVLMRTACDLKIKEQVQKKANLLF